MNYEEAYKNGYQKGLEDADERNRPMRPFYEYAKPLRCPECGRPTISKWVQEPYCFVCGQRILWEDEE